MTRSTGAKILLGAACALVAAVAHSNRAEAGLTPTFDLTGTWTGKTVCTFQANGVKFRVPYPGTMTISQSGAAVNVLVDDGSAGSFQYQGWAQANAKKSNQGATTFVECLTTPQNNVYNEVVGALATIRPTKKNAANAVLVGTSGYGQTDGSGNPVLGGVCKYRFTRTSTADPGVTGCVSP